MEDRPWGGKEAFTVWYTSERQKGVNTKMMPELQIADKGGQWEEDGVSKRKETKQNNQKKDFLKKRESLKFRELRQFQDGNEGGRLQLC